MTEGGTFHKMRAWADDLSCFRLSCVRLRCFRLGLGLAAAVAVLDQATKWWIVQVVMQPPKVIPVTPFFNLVMGWNRGVSFGLFNQESDFNSWVLIGVAAVIITILIVWMYRAETHLTAVALGFVIGGAVGNVIDRVWVGAVADFLDFHIAGYHWPAFNLADSAIFMGAAALILESLFRPSERPKNKASDRTDAEG